MEKDKKKKEVAVKKYAKPCFRKVVIAGEDCRCKVSAWSRFSDRALKIDISPARDSLEKVLSLKGMTFKWKNGGRQDIGLIAQDVERVYPELVSTDPVTGLKSVEYGNLIAPLIEAIKTQQQQINQLKDEMKHMKSNGTEQSCSCETFHCL
jgi:hypothetical protein